MRKIILFFMSCLFFIFCILLPQDKASAKNDLSYDEIQKVIDEMGGGNGESFQFGEQVEQWMTGEKNISLESIGSILLKSFQTKWKESGDLFIQLFSIAVMGALFTNFSDVFKNSQVAETGFYASYLLLFTILTVAFVAASSLVAATLNTLLDFMKVLLPTYFITVTFSAGVTTSMVFYESTLALITLVDLLLIHIVIPMVNIYFILNLVKNLIKEDMLSKFIELLEMVIGWIMKTLFSLVIGFHVIQGMIVPVADYVKSSVLMKTAKAIPGVGNTFSSVAETVLGTGVLVKNAVGVAGLIVIIIICGMPILQLAFSSLLYEVSSAVLQPISDKRMVNCISGTSKAVRFLLYTITTGAILFLFTIAIITSSTNFRLKG